MINSKKGVGSDETVSLLLFMLGAAIVYIFLSSLHSAQQAQNAEDISDQLLRAQMENELLQFLQLPYEKTIVANMIIKANYNNDFVTLSEIAKQYFSGRKFGSYEDWGLIIQQPGEVGIQLNTGAATIIAKEHVAIAYLPLPSEGDTYLEVKLYLAKARKQA